ncbi:MAG TPA: pilus assembly protein TadG-related protein [Hyphomicrobiaceae bacterium]|nr:pilus assembly protein TadG-related protein [Hyphomicrobiaceae bacterium]
MARLRQLLGRFRRDESGAFMVLFAVIALVLIATSGAVVDFTYVQTARSRAQNALDAAALALQSRISTDSNSTLKSKAQNIMTERLADTAITATVNTATVDTTNGKLAFQASVQVPTAFIQLVGIKSITAQLTSEVTKGSKNLEVSASLDITGSMAGTKITDLISATNTLIDLVVQDTQTPTYSKMAIVPWAFAANLGSYANNVRGTPTPGKSITNATWMSTSTVNINAITNANPAVITTSAAHGLSTGDYVYVSGVHGMTNSSSTARIPDGIYKVTKVDNSNVKLLKTDGTNIDSRTGQGWSAYNTSPSKGKITGCLTSNCEVVVTANSHGLASGDNVYITGVGGMTQLNDTISSPMSPTLKAVGTTTTNTYVLPSVTVSNVGYTAYTNGGTSYCVEYGCSYLYFRNNSNSSWYGGYELWQPNNCVTERTTANAYTDVAPSTTYLGFDYTDGGASCVNQVVQPLTTNKTTLHNLANSLTATGSTAGHLGLAWGWYMISPNFGYLWPAASAPAAYSGANLVKAVILMTDGDFNSAYCNGVIAADSGSGSGNDWDHINCNATNGDSKSQATTLCANIKAEPSTTLYTVGFDLGSNTTALNFLKSCASAPSDFFRADTGTDLTNAFKSIAQNLNSLRISR